MIDELVATLHFHGYLQMESSNIYGGAPLNVVANDHKIDNIQEYIDDLYIDLFFRTHEFKPIRIPKDWKIQRYSKDGEEKCEGGIKLCLNSPFDRYTLVSCIANCILGNRGYLNKSVPQNKFLSSIIVDYKKYGPIWECPVIKFEIPKGDEFEQYLNYLYGMKHSMYNPTNRAQDILYYSEMFQSKVYNYCYKNLTNYGLMTISKRQQGYKDIKDIDLFGEYTLEDILMIYCLLVYKFRMEEDSFMSFIGLFANGNKHTFLHDFRDFEMQVTDAESVKPYIRDRDLFLRFTSPTKSKAVKFNLLGNGIAEIQFFKDKPIRTVFSNNSLPLPFLYNELY